LSKVSPQRNLEKVMFLSKKNVISNGERGYRTKSPNATWGV